MNNNEPNLSPKNKKINYYEENPKLFKKGRPRASLERISILNDENLNDNTNIRLNFDDNIILNPDVLTMPGNSSVSQPNNYNNIPNNNCFSLNNVLDDFLNELDEEEQNKKGFNSKGISMASELNGLFERNKYSTYFQTSRTQNPQISNIWDDFHQKRDKI
jgi:hypothetical protein